MAVQHERKEKYKVEITPDPENLTAVNLNVSWVDGNEAHEIRNQYPSIQKLIRVISFKRDLHFAALASSRVFTVGGIVGMGLAGADYMSAPSFTASVAGLAGFGSFIESMIAGDFFNEELNKNRVILREANDLSVSINPIVLAQ